MTIPEMLTYFTVGTISIVSAIGFIAKSVFNNYLNQKTENFKSELGKENELFKVQLQRNVYEHQIKFSSLHNERAEVIKGLYKKLVELRSLLSSSIQKSNIAKFDVEKSKEIWTLSNETFKEFNSNKLYFKQDLCYKIEEFLKGVQATNFLFEIHEKGDEYKVLHFEKEINKEQILKILDETKTLIELEKEFRELIGVN
jgi:hypothetical protein